MGQYWHSRSLRGAGGTLRLNLEAEPWRGSRAHHARTGKLTATTTCRRGAGLMSRATATLCSRRGVLLFAAIAASIAAGCERRRDPPPTGSTPPPAITLTRGLGGEPDTLDPRLAQDNAAIAVIGDLYEGLTRETADGGIEAGAASDWTRSDDGRVYTFRLRPALRWSNGDTLNAGHFVAGLREAMGPGSAAPYASLLAPVESVEAPQPGLLRITLRAPLAYLPAVLALPVATPRHPAGDGLEAPPSNGPYRLRARQPGAWIELERNPHYHEPDAVQIDRVRYLTVADLATEVNLYRSDALDVTSEVPNAHNPWLRQNMADELRISPYLSVYSYVVNLARIPDAERRQALAMALDRERLVAQVTGAGERPAYGWVADGLPDYAAARFRWRTEPAGERITYARMKWNSAGQRAPPTRIKLCTDASANHHRTAVAVADMWRTALGIETEILELEWKVYLATRRAPGDCDLIRLGWSADFLDAQAFLDVFRGGHPQNTLGYSNERYDSLLEQAAQAGNSALRSDLLRQAEQLLLDDAPVIPLFFRSSKRLIKPHVRGYRDNPLDHLPSRQLRIEGR